MDNHTIFRSSITYYTIAHDIPKFDSSRSPSAQCLLYVRLIIYRGIGAGYRVGYLPRLLG